MNPGRELDVLVAEKVLGLVITYVPECECIGAPLENMPYVGVGTDDERYLPAYSTYIGAAWEVVEKLSEQFSFSCWHAISISSVCWGWNVAFDASVYPPDRTRCNRESVALSRQETMPHAICLAALQAVGAYEEKPWPPASA